MALLCQYDGFLPVENDGASTSTLYRVDLPPSVSQKGRRCWRHITESVSVYFRQRREKFSAIVEYFRKAKPPQRNIQGNRNDLACRSMRMPPHLRRVVLLLDISDSMSLKMGDLKRAILSTVTIILDQKKASLDQIVLITFHSHSRVYLDFKDYESFEKVISDLTARECSNYCSAIDELTKLLKKKQEVIAVMFSGGVPTNEKGGVLTADQYLQSVEKLRKAANDKSLLFHSIGLKVGCAAEKILKNLTTVGSTEGFYQFIDGAEITASMNVLVDHFHCTVEPLINGARTRNGFVVCADTNDFVAQYQGKEIALTVTTKTFQEMLEKNEFNEILEALRFLLEYHLRSNEAVTFERATSIVDRVFYLIGETEDEIKSIQQDKITACSSEKEAKIESAGTETGASHLKRHSEIISEYNRKIQQVWKDYSKLLRDIRELKELCARIRETLHLDRNISASISGEIMNVVSQFRDKSIAQKRKRIARFSSKVIEANNILFQKIDQLLQDELDQLLKLESIPVPECFENYSDPITLNNFKDTMLYKCGVFMLLIKVERHHNGIIAPHKTKISEVSSVSPSVLDVMAKNEDISVLFDYRGIGAGNAAVPLWISDLHWQKAQHLFGPFVGHAVTCNELEYLPLQGMTLLALILIHLRQLESTEFNRQLIQMVQQTLNVVLEKAKWQAVAEELCNSFDKLNESVIPSVEVFLVFQEFIPTIIPEEKVLLLLAEQYRRENAKGIRKFYERVTARNRNTRTGDVETTRPIKGNKGSYFLSLYDGENDSRLLKWFDRFAKKLGPSLSSVASGLTDKQKMAIVLSSHKCTLFEWNAWNEVPAGLSYDSNYPDILLGWSRRVIDTKKQQNPKTAKPDENTKLDEDTLLQKLQTEDETEAETFLRGIKRNSQSWGVLLKILLPPSKLTPDQPEEDIDELYGKHIENLSIPLHFQMIMFCIFDSFEPKDWVSSKMKWRPKPQTRRIIRSMFPTTPEIEWND